MAQLPWYSRAWVSTVSAFSPTRGIVAAHFSRLEHDRDYRDGVLLALRSQGYRDAKESAVNTPFGATAAARSADAHDLTNLHLRKLREKARELERDDPVGTGLVGIFVRNVVGAGLEDRAMTGDNDADNAIDTVWRRLRDDLFPAERVSWFEAQRILQARCFVDGDVFVKRSSALDGSRIFFEIIEGDRVLTPLDVEPALRDRESYVREGVERDRWGRITAYWVAKRHPGDTVMTGSMGKLPLPPTTRADFERVPADQIRHLRSPSRPGQSRSPSRFHAIAQALRDLDLLVIAVLKRIQVAASFAVFLETTSEVPDLMAATAKKYHYQLDQDLVPGMIYVLRPGEKATTLNPNFPLPDLDVFVRLLARRIGAALGISWQIVLSDFSQSNFASQRADRIEAEASYALPQQRLMDVLRWIRQGCLEDAMLRGELEFTIEGAGDAGSLTDGLSLTSMIPPRKRWVDPKAQADADAVDLANGLACKRDLAAERGRDWEDILMQRLREESIEMTLRDELGLPQVNLTEVAIGSSAARAGEKGGNNSPSQIGGQKPGGRGRRRRPNLVKGIAGVTGLSAIETGEAA